MRFIKITLKPNSAFGTPLLGDTLFGHLCWAIRNRFGENTLEVLLKGYTENNPFAIVSDAFPSGFLPRPAIPLWLFKATAGNDRKEIKSRVWFPSDQTDRPVVQWLDSCVSEDEWDREETGFINRSLQPHNSINRLTGTTGKDQFAPFSMEQDWYQDKVLLDCYVLFEEDRLQEKDLLQCFTDIGEFGFGRDASIGMGKFFIENPKPVDFKIHQSANSFLTLAPCAPQGLGYEKENSYYQPFTRFGKHGDFAASFERKPFKNPVLLTKSGAVFKTRSLDSLQWIGQGIGGNRSLSKAIPNTVHQGYSPVVPVLLSE